MSRSASRIGSDVRELIEDQLERNLSPRKLKRYLELVGPFLLVITYLEDAIRCARRAASQPAQSWRNLQILRRRGATPQWLNADEAESDGREAAAYTLSF